MLLGSQAFPSIVQDWQKIDKTQNVLPEFVLCPETFYSKNE
jgi:hypothetical protein